MLHKSLVNGVKANIDYCANCEMTSSKVRYMATQVACELAGAVMIYGNQVFEQEK